MCVFVCVQGVYVCKSPLSMGYLSGLVNVVGRTILRGTVVLNQDIISLSRNRTGLTSSPPGAKG